MATPKQLSSELSKGKFKSAYYFYGSEDFRISQAVKYLINQYLPSKQQALNCQRIDGKKTKAGDISTMLSTLPMLGEKQVFVISEFQSFRPKEVQSILSLIASDDPSRIVVFTSPSSKAPKKSSAFFKSVSAKTEVVEFNKLNIAEVRALVSGKLSKANLAINQEALTLFSELIAGNRGALESEIDKLINYKNSGEEISKDDIQTLTNGYEIFKIFELADYVVAGGFSRVLKMLRSLVAEGNAPVVLTTLLQQHFSSLYLVKNNKKPIGNRQFLVYKFKEQASRYKPEELERIIIDIAETDSELRKQKFKPELALEMLAVSLMGQNN